MPSEKDKGNPGRCGAKRPDCAVLQAGDAAILPNDPDQPQNQTPLPARHGRRGLWLSLGLVALLTAVAFGVLALTGKPIRLPVWAVAEAESRVNRAIGNTLEPGASVALGGAVVLVGRDWVPRLQLEDLRLLTAAGRTIAMLPEVQVAIDPQQLVSGVVRPKTLRIIGAQVTLRRLADGRFDVVLGADAAGPPPGSLAEVLDRIEAVLALPALSTLARIEAEALTLTLDDRGADRVWQVGDGRLALDNRMDEVALALGFGLVGGGAAPARADVTFVSQKSSSAARIVATVDQVAAADLAAQTPALAWLGVLDAPISGRLSAALDDAGRLSGTDGTLAIGSGALRPTDQTRPIPFAQAGLSFALDTAAETIAFTDLTVESSTLRLSASGKTRVPGLAAGRPEAFISQVRISDLRVDPEGLFEEPVRFSDGAVDLRLTLDPFKLEIGQLALREGSRRLLAKGAATAEPKGWSLSLDIDLNEITHDRLLALWPVGLVSKTRVWLVDNVQEGLLFDVAARLRLRPEAEPRLSLGYEFAGADVRFVRTLPPIRDGYGYATLSDQTYTIVLDKGGVTPPEGGRIDVAGSVLRVADITQKPAQAELTLKTHSSITAAMSLLDEPPFGFLSKAGYPVSVAEGRAAMVARLNLPLQKKVLPQDVIYTVEGVLSDVSSDQLVKGRVLRADRLELRADNAGLTIGGPGLLGKARFDAVWTQAFGPAAKGKSRVEGVLDMSPATLDEFGIRLPENTVTGRGSGQIALDLAKGGGTFRLTSDLNGLDLRLAAIGLAKDADAKALLEVEGRLGRPAAIDLLRLESGAVSVLGTVALRPEGGLDVARFETVKSGDWLDAAIELTGQGPGTPVAIAITGGAVDLRYLPAGGGGGDGPPMDVALDRLTVTAGIALTDLRGRFASKGGMNGDFTAQVNGAAPVTGAVAPTTEGTAARIRSADAGAVLAAAGIFDKARGGTLDLTLRPRGGKGIYDGTATVGNIQIRDAPILAALLGAISVVGLLQQLNDSGLVFSSAEAQFRTSPEGVTISRASAVGASLGVSLGGTYRTATGGLDMQGVLSPIYILNGIGSILTRPGEGLFGFNFKLGGTAAAPDISVNPLSILTPGMFREIFRSAPPGG